MKRVMLVLLIALSFSFVNAKCELGVSLISQDPYPAVPGDYVKLLFQVTGTENPDCAYATFELTEEYPISFDPGQSGFVQIKGGTFARDYSTSLTVPFKVRLDSNTLDGANRIEVVYSSGENLSQNYQSKLFDIEVEDTRADFEVYVKDYEPSTKILTLEILNIAESDVEALTVELVEEGNIKISGARTDILGDLDSNEYTTADFTVEPNEGNIKLKVSYSDSINQRRTIEKQVYFNPSYFMSTDEKNSSWYTYIIAILVLGIVVYFFYKRRKKKKERHQRRGMARLG